MKTVRNMRLGILVLCLALAVLFSGCGLIQKAQDMVVETALQGAVDFAIDAAVGENQDVSRVAESLQAKVQMQVLTSSISGDGITAKCTITAPDLTEFIGSFNLNDYKNAQELCDAAIAAIENAPAVQKEVNIGLVKNGESYELQELEAFLNAYFGGGIDILNDLQDQLTK